MNNRRQKNQLQMRRAFTEENRSEAPKTLWEGAKSFPAKSETVGKGEPPQTSYKPNMKFR